MIRTLLTTTLLSLYSCSPAVAQTDYIVQGENSVENSQTTYKLELTPEEDYFAVVSIRNGRTNRMDLTPIVRLSNDDVSIVLSAETSINGNGMYGTDGYELTPDDYTVLDLTPGYYADPDTITINEDEFGYIYIYQMPLG